MNDTEQFDAILVPADWTVEQDLAFYEERWAEDALDYAQGLRSAMLIHCAGLVRVIDAALRYFYSRDLTLFPFPPECLSTSEKLDILESIVNENPRDAPYRERLQADICLCHWAEAERSRIFAEHHKNRGESWLYPIVAAIDLCGTAAFALEETMECEHDDFVMLPLD